MTPDSAAPETAKPVFGKGAWVFLGAVGAVFVSLALAIPIVIIADAAGSSGGSAGPGPAPVTTVAPAPGGDGEQLAASTGCVACHSTDGTVLVGPSWLGLAGSERQLESGEMVVADDAYLNTSILDPAAQVVAGFDPLMPATYRDQLSDQEIASLIEYIKSLA